MGLEMTREVSWRRVGRALFVILVVIPVVVCGGIWLVEAPVDHVRLWHLAREAEGYRGANLVVRPLPDELIVDRRDGTTISTFGYSMRVPCSGLSSHRTWKEIDSFSFGRSCSVLVLVKNADMEGRRLVVDAPAEELITRLYGAGALKSNYSFMKAELETPIMSPSFFRSNASNGAALTALELRTLVANEADEAYEISSGHVRGFQFGDLRKTNRVILKLFDQRDRDVRIVLEGPKPGQVGALTQEDVNAVVASVVPPA